MRKQNIEFKRKQTNYQPKRLPFSTTNQQPTRQILMKSYSIDKRQRLPIFSLITSTRPPTEQFLRQLSLRRQLIILQNISLQQWCYFYNIMLKITRFTSSLCFKINKYFLILFAKNLEFHLKDKNHLNVIPQTQLFSLSKQNFQLQIIQSNIFSIEFRLQQGVESITHGEYIIKIGGIKSNKGELGLTLRFFISCLSDIIKIELHDSCILCQFANEDSFIMLMHDQIFPHLNVKAQNSPFYEKLQRVYIDLNKKNIQQSQHSESTKRIPFTKIYKVKQKENQNLQEEQKHSSFQQRGSQKNNQEFQIYKSDTQCHIPLSRKPIQKENYKVVIPKTITQLGIKRRNYTEEQIAQFSIDPKNIIEDGRTSLMIKNIPNKYTQQMLKEAIDQTHAHDYDFLYLPIDFQNKCNVGYAFLNLKKAKSVYSFYKIFHHNKWEFFNSEKICEISYARLQGFQALKKHFLTSSIRMQKDKKLKPLILA